MRLLVSPCQIEHCRVHLEIIDPWICLGDCIKLYSQKTSWPLWPASGSTKSKPVYERKVLYVSNGKSPLSKIYIAKNMWTAPPHSWTPCSNAARATISLIKGLESGIVAAGFSKFWECTSMAQEIPGFNPWLWFPLFGAPCDSDRIYDECACSAVSSSFKKPKNWALHSEVVKTRSVDSWKLSRDGHRTLIQSLSTSSCM